MYYPPKLTELLRLWPNHIWHGCILLGSAWGSRA